MNDRFRSLLVTLLAATAGCFPGGIDDPGPSGPVENADISGVWSYTAELAGPGATCEVDDVTITIEQLGGMFSGSTEGGTVTCFRAGEIIEEALPSFDLEDGVVVGVDMRMAFMSRDFWRHVGVVFSEASMGGQTDWNRDFGEGVGVIFLSTGTWQADRVEE